jgi:hypothetical protein
VTRGGTLLAALLVTLATPTTWPLALATFLVRGGILIVLLPIVVLPTTVGIGTAFGPTLLTVAFGSIPNEVIVLAAGIGSGSLAWLVVGGWLAAALEAAGARIVAGDEEVAALGGGSPTGASGMSESGSAIHLSPPAGRVATRILIARLAAYVPFGVVVALGSIRLIFVTYRELTAPLDVATPITIRVLRGSPEVVVGVVVAWMLAEIVAAVAARRIALRDARVGAALAHAVSVVLRQPAMSLAQFWLPSFVLLIVLLPSALAAASAWEAVGTVLNEEADPLRLLAAVSAFVGLWIVGLVLVGVVCAWRAAIWTVAEVVREGTFGGSADRRPGHWRLARSSATLRPGRPLGRSRRRGER